jgi:hypothetical protein
MSKWRTVTERGGERVGQGASDKEWPELTYLCMVTFTSRGKVRLNSSYSLFFAHMNGPFKFHCKIQNFLFGPIPYIFQQLPLDSPII